ncbi:MAG: hypothetical protein Q7S79_02740 [bacterium]|nr:hypothetical protein [bacterium]
MIKKLKMLLMQKLQPLKNFLRENRIPLLVLLAVTLLAGNWLLRPGYFNMHDDLQMFRQLSMEECFKDGQIPCRWTRHMGYGFGYPLFNYYPPLPYLFGEVVRVLGFSYITSVKIAFLFAFLASALTMYIFTKEFWGKTGGLLSAIFYTWAPYHSLDIYVRGAMNEAWALIWFPLILWSSYKLIEGKKFNQVIVLALAWFALLTSHNLMVLIFAPAFALWCLLWIIKNKSWKSIPLIALSGLWGIGLAGFFFFPVLLEKKFVQVDSLVAGYYNYIVHYVSLNQLLFSRFWGYGASVWLEDDDMGFQIGYLHWILPLVTGSLVFRDFLKNKKLTNVSLVTCFLLLAGWFAAFMAHSRSTFIWRSIPGLEFVQFPWRFLTLVTLFFSSAVGSLVLFVKDKKKQALLIGVLTVAVVALNINYFKPEKMGPLTDEQKFSGLAYDLQQTSGIFDYLPNTAKTAPKAKQVAVAEVTDQTKGVILNSGQNSNTAWFDVDLKENVQIRIGILQFPGWTVYVDGVRANSYVDEKEEWGRIYVDVPTGKHSVKAKLENTPPRTVGNAVSVASWLALLTVPFLRRRITV